MSVFKIKNRKEVFAWSLYDFANQPFTTIIVTFIYSAFFVKVIAVNEQEGTFLWTNAIAITAVVVSLLSPILGALADKNCKKHSPFQKQYLQSQNKLVHNTLHLELGNTIK